MSGRRSRDAQSDARQEFKRLTLAQRRATFPPLRRAIAADARVAARQDRPPTRLGRWVQLGVLVSGDPAFVAVALYRLKAAGQARGVPVLPRLAHRLAMAVGQVCIGDPVVMAPGVLVPRGQVVLDGVVDVASGVVLSEHVTIGLKAGDLRGPVIERDVVVGAGAKILGPVTVGHAAVIEPNAVVVADVPPTSTVGGVPARVLG